VYFYDVFKHDALNYRLRGILICISVGERFKDFGKLLKNNSDILNLT